MDEDKYFKIKAELRAVLLQEGKLKE